MNKDIVNYHMFIKDTCPTAWTDHFWFAAELVKWFKARTVVDLGVDYGYSTFAFATHGQGKVFGIDSFKGDEHAGQKNTLNATMRTIYDAKHTFGVNNIEIIPAYFDQVASVWDRDIDILHIDGLHTYEAVKHDYFTWAKFTHERSVILFHDIHSYPDTVGKFFYELSGYKFVRDGSFGLGVLCQDKGIYEFILSLSNSIDNYVNSLEQSVPESE
jgi:hypothetical protein